MKRPFPAYHGDGPYVFVCYAHDDADVVYPELAWLQEQGVNLWYDEGISAGKVWREEIGDALTHARQVLFYISSASLRSEHCDREINLALDDNKEIIPVYLEKLDLTPGLRVGLSRVHALHREQDSDYRQRLLKSLEQDRITDSPVAARPPGISSHRRSIAVLPFDNMSGDADQEYFSDGITEEVMSALSKSSELLVIARNSTFTYKGRRVRVQQVGQELGVQHVLEGSVRKAGNRVRITAELVDASTGGRLWAENYERELNDIFEVQIDIAQRITGALRVEFTEAELARVKRMDTDDLTARDCFWRGLAFYRRLSGRESNARAREFFERAIEMDSGFAVAYAHIGWCYSWDEFMGWHPDPTNYAKAIELGQKAVAINGSSSPAHVLLAWVRSLTRQLDLAMAEVELSLALDPNDDVAYHIKGVILYFKGEWEESIPFFKQAIDLHPHHGAEYLATMAASYMYSGQYGVAIASLQKAITINPESSIACYWLTHTYRNAWLTQKMPDHDILGLSLTMAKRTASLREPRWANQARVIEAEVQWLMGNQEKTLADVEGMIADDPGDLDVREMLQVLLAAILTATGRPDESLAAVEESIGLNPRGSPSLYNTLGLAYRLSGDLPKALSAFEQIFTRAFSHPFVTHTSAFSAHLNLAILYIELGQEQKARAAAAEVLQLSPDFSVEVWGQRNPDRNKAQIKGDMAALSKAGLR
ncbi:MAG: TIR domain-containing protein [Pseudomonadales bacterium]|nr:TIR domain-containing protein [Pseudomonadales bacterium]HJN50779.1 TIR domain-containing protein [Pseudomonadales bacterium]